MTREEYDQLDSDRKLACPDCGLKGTTPHPGCHCPPTSTTYGKRHINKWHHNCEDARRQEEKAHG